MRQIKSTMEFHGRENKRPTIEDIMKIFHEPGFMSTSNNIQDYETVDPTGHIVALT